MKDTELNDGGPAFPHPEFSTKIHNGIRVYDPHAGMSLRDWFAGQAMSAILISLKEQGIQEEDIPNMAGDCFLCADAMLAERNRKEEA